MYKTFINFFKLILFVSLFSSSLYSVDYGTGTGGTSTGGTGSGNNIDIGGDSEGDEKQFDAWDLWIDDDTPPDSDARTISTKIVNRPFKLSLASISSDGNDYETKDANSSTADNSVEVAIYENIDGGAKISNNVYFDPTDNDHLDSADITVTQASKDAIVGIRLCTEIDDNKHYIIHKFGDCDASGDDNKCDESTDGDAKFVICYASNNFAIRPKLFNITQQIDTISGEDKKFHAIAEDENGNATQKYTLDNDGVVSDSDEATEVVVDFLSSGGENASIDDYDLNLSVTKYMPNDEVNDSLYGDSNLTAYKFEDGNASDGDNTYLSIHYNDVGYVNLEVQDQNWSDVDKDDTPDGCSNEDGENIGRYICGDTNTTYVPDHFSLTQEIKIYDHNDSNFTYIANDYNISAHLEIEVKAINAEGNITKNFDINSWVNPLTIDFITEHETDINKSIISDVNLSFQEGAVTIPWDEQNLSKNLLFNYTREINSSVNPFMVKADEINITILSQYSEIHISDDNGSDIGGDDSNATFLYARVNTPRTRFVKSSDDTYRVNIYYETFCYATDKYNNSCDKTLLPDGEDSAITDDPRWFINTKHNNTDHTFGLALNVTQKRGDGVSVDTQPTGDYLDSVTLHYNGILPYKTTMENEASSWLIYQKYDSEATKDDFEVEFNKATGEEKSWAGVSEDDVSKTDVTDITTRTNRRSMW